jgi:hypothetical protein
VKRNPTAGRDIVLAMIIALVVLLIGKPLGIRIGFASAFGAFAASCIAITIVHAVMKPRSGRPTATGEPSGDPTMPPQGTAN